MLRILIIIMVLMIGIIVGPMLSGHQGMVLIQMQGYRITMSVTTFVIVEIVLFGIVYFIYTVLKAIFNSHSILSEWLDYGSSKKATKRFETAQLSLLEGDTNKAIKLLDKSARFKNNRTLSHLQAAQIEIDHNHLEQASSHIQQINQPCPSEYQFAFSLIQLKLQLKLQQYESAYENVEKLLDKQPRNPEVLRLAYQFFTETRNFQEIIELLPAMFKTEIYPADQLTQIEQQVYAARINQLAGSVTLGELLAWWNEQPKTIRRNNDLKGQVEVYLGHQIK